MNQLQQMDALADVDRFTVDKSGTQRAATQSRIDWVRFPLQGAAAGGGRVRRHHEGGLPGELSDAVARKQLYGTGTDSHPQLEGTKEQRAMWRKFWLS